MPTAVNTEPKRASIRQNLAGATLLTSIAETPPITDQIRLELRVSAQALKAVAGLANEKPIDLLRGPLTIADLRSAISGIKQGYPLMPQSRDHVKSYLEEQLRLSAIKTLKDNTAEAKRAKRIDRNLGWIKKGLLTVGGVGIVTAATLDIRQNMITRFDSEAVGLDNTAKNLEAARKKITPISPARPEEQELFAKPQDALELLQIDQLALPKDVADRLGIINGYLNQADTRNIAGDTDFLKKARGLLKDSEEDLKQAAKERRDKIPEPLADLSQKGAIIGGVTLFFGFFPKYLRGREKQKSQNKIRDAKLELASLRYDVEKF